MISDWKTCALNEIAAFGNGKTRPKTEGDIPIYGGNGILGHSGSSNYQDETIIIGRVGAYCGATYYENNPIWVSDNALSAKAKEGYVSKYAYYVLKNKNLNQYAQGSSHPLLTQGLLNSIEAHVTTNLDTQKKIVSIISGLEEKIELNRQTNQTLEAIAQALFKSWFVDFDPVKAKISVLESGGSVAAAELASMSVISSKSLAELVEFKQSNTEEYKKLTQTAALFPSAMQESELGDIPEEWKVTFLREIIEFNPRRKLVKGTLAPYLDMKNVPTEGHLANEVVLREMASGTKFINGDTLLARITPCLENGKTAFVDFLEEDQVGWGSTEYIVMRPKNNRPTSLGYMIARLDSFRAKAAQTMTGTSGRQRANAAALAEQKWINYPSELLEEFDRIAGGYLAVARANGKQNKILADIRNATLPKLLSGELKVK